MTSTHNRVDPQTLVIELNDEQGGIVKDDLKHLVIELNEQAVKDDLKHLVIDLNNEQGVKGDLKFFWP